MLEGPLRFILGQHRARNEVARHTLHLFLRKSLEGGAEFGSKLVSGDVCRDEWFAPFAKAFLAICLKPFRA